MNMTKEEFCAIMRDIQFVYDRGIAISRASDGNLSTVNYDDAFFKIINSLLLHIFTKEEVNTIYWWKYESVDRCLTINGVETCLPDVEDLYDYLISLK